MMDRLKRLSPEQINRVIEMAWEDRTPFDAVEFQFGLPEKAVIELMRRELKPSSWRRWRRRVSGRKTKHGALHPASGGRFRCSRQRGVSGNKIT